MSRKHFIALAAAFLDVRPPLSARLEPQRRQWELDLIAVAHVLATTNDLFDRRRFLDAAGLYAEEATV